MAITLEAIKEELNEWLRQLKEALAKRAAFVLAMDEAVEKAKAEYQPDIAALDVIINGLVDKITRKVKLHRDKLFPTPKGTKELVLPAGIIKVYKELFTHTVVDEKSLLDLLRRRKVINKIAPAVRKIIINQLKKLPNIMNAAVDKGFVARTGGGEIVSVKPNDADTVGAPKLTRPI